MSLCLSTECANEHALERWVIEQIAFWYGSNYQQAVGNSWNSVAELLKHSDYGQAVRRYPTLADDTLDRIRLCYTQLPEYNFEGNVEVIIDIRQHDLTHKLTAAHCLPVLMVDEIGLSLPVISYNRIATDDKSCAFLWPNSYHVRIARSGLEDDLPFREKAPKVIFRGALSGPMRDLVIGANAKKLSRAQYLLKLPAAEQTLDLGVTSIPSHLYANPDFLQIRGSIEAISCLPIPFPQILSSRFILCLEGADVSSGFAGALASQSVPMHPYPFCYETWFFNGLEPWVHFIPLSEDASDLFEAFDYCERHPTQAEKIAHAGRAHMFAMADEVRLRSVKAGFVDLWNFKGC
jgi:hypothetical protein